MQTTTTSLLTSKHSFSEDIQQFLEDQANDFTKKFPQESYISPKASSYPHKTSLI